MSNISKVDLSNGHNGLREFGNCRLDVKNHFLWCGDAHVQLPPKALELLCVLVEKRGGVVTKKEIWEQVWKDSFVEETNLTHNIYLLRKRLKDLGEPDVIKTVPRRGYRFAAEVRDAPDPRLIVEKHSRTRTQIEITEEIRPALKTAAGHTGVKRHLLAFASVLVFASLGFGLWYAGVFSMTNSRINSIAVLPFRVLNAERDHSGIGIADTLITRLSAIKGLYVRPTSAVAVLSDSTAVEAGKTLDVHAILEGTIYRTSDQVRITARLVRTADESVIWSGEFQKPIQDEITAQNELATHIVDALAVNLTEGERSNILKSYTGNAEAYRLYEKGRFEWNKRNYSGMVEAQRLFRNAIEKDPNFALAYSGLADTLATGSAWTEASHAATMALRLDPTLAEAHATDGFIKMFGRWDWDGAEKAFQNSISLNSGYATAHHWYATLLAIRGRNDEAKAEMQRAIDINPQSPNYLADMGQLFYFSKDYGKAKDLCDQALKLNPDFIFAHQYLHYIYLKSGEAPLAIEEIIAADRLNGVELGGKSLTDHAYFDRFRKAFGENGVRGFLEHRYSGKPTDPQAFYLYAMKHALLGENEAALAYLEKAAEAKTFLTAFVKADPVFEGLHGNARFSQILHTMSLDG